MADRKKLLDRLKERLNDLLEAIDGALSPPPELIPIPVKPEQSSRAVSRRPLGSRGER